VRERPRSVHLRLLQSGTVAQTQPPPGPPPPSWFPAPAPRRTPDTAIIGIVLAVVVFAVFGLIIVLSAFSFAGFGGFGFMSFLGLLCIPLLVVIVLVVILASGGFGRRTIPPPPPIQQPMVPAGQQGPVALSCPNCGGPPTNVDRFGIATCSYCGTRFLVR